MKQAWANGQWQTFTYDGDGRRVRRTDPALGEIWQVYGLDGELLAEYKSNGPAILPQKEYGYRNGQLLVTAANGDGLRLWNFMKNVAVRFGVYGSASGDSQLLSAANALSTAGAQGQSQMLSAARTQVQNVIMWSNIPSDADYVTALYLSYLQRFPESNELNAWVSQVPTIGRDAVRDGFAYSDEFAARVSSLRGTASSDTERTDAFVQYVYNAILHRWASSSEDTSAISMFDNVGATGQAGVVAAAKDLARGLFNSAEYTSRPGLTPHDFVYDLYQTLYGSPPDNSWDYWTDQVGANWENKQAVLDHFINAGPFDQKAATLYREVLWLVPDQLGTPRMIAERTGSLAGIKRHDYLPFGEELFAGTGGRTTAQGYVGDNVRQKFTRKERDIETGLDYFEARYFGSAQGRFTSPDPLGGHTEDPQTLDRYTYVRNNPQTFTDPTGLDFYLTCEKDSKTCHGGQVGTTDKKGNFTATLIRNDKNGCLVDQNGNRYTATVNGQGVSFTQSGSNQAVLGVFQNGTSATTIQGSGNLAGFTFNFTSSNLNTNITAQGTWTFNGRVDQTERALESAGFFHYPPDNFNREHPSTDAYDAVDYRSPGDENSNGSGHFTVHEPVTNIFIPPRGGPGRTRIPGSSARIAARDTVPTAGDVHFGEHNPWSSPQGLYKHMGEWYRSHWP